MDDDRAIVLGAGVAGLLTAVALAETFAQVAIVERDILANEVSQDPRRGVPQGKHAHGLLGGGLRAVEDLLPGATAELIALGVPAGDTLGNVRFCPNGLAMRQVEIGEPGLSPGRPILESYLRTRALALPGVTLIDDADIVGLEIDDERKRVTGARIRRHPAEQDELLEAALVVDATGRGSRLPLWLEEWGYPRPEQDVLRVDLTYTSGHFAVDPERMDGDLAIILAPSLDCPRGGVLQLLGRGRAIVTLFGLMGDSAPADDQGFLEFAGSLPLPFIHQVIQDAAPLDELTVIRFPASVRNRYERMSRFPQGLLALGDAICSFNPLYGQGMTVTAMEAVALRQALRAGPVDARAFFRRIRPMVDNPWQVVVGGDLAFAQVPGTPSRMGRFVNAYLRRLHVAAQRDAALSTAFARVANLTVPPTSLLRPDRMARVLWGGWRARSLRPPAA